MVLINLFGIMADYRVKLDVYNGPLDLLLYLIRREEVDVHDIPIARITDQYVRHIEVLKTLDANLAGEFLVMAATLMEIKTHMLLPSVSVEDAEADDMQLDPRAELVRQLLEYKAFKDAAGNLHDAAALQATKYPRSPIKFQSDNQRELDLEDVQVWDLMDAFSNLMESIGHRIDSHDVIYDDTPTELHAADILDRLKREGSLSFGDIFAGRTNRSEIIGLFLALLELVRSKRVSITQEKNFSTISVELNSDPPEEEPQVRDHTNPNN